MSCNIKEALAGRGWREALAGRGKGGACRSWLEGCLQVVARGAFARRGWMGACRSWLEGRLQVVAGSVVVGGILAGRG